MKLEDLIRGIAITDRRGHFDREIRTLTHDSRRIGDGDVFVAINGTGADGHEFIPEAVQKGARAVIAERWEPGWDQGGSARVNVVLVPNPRRAMALAAANMFGEPSRDMLVAGVTGTNGKTTVTHILEAIFNSAGKKAGVIGTVGARYPGRSIPLVHTTPDPVTLQGILAKMLVAEVSHVAMEVSSHAVDQDRVAGIHFKVCGFTNLTQDHLDYHRDQEAYFQAKAKLFTDVLQKSSARGRMAVINTDDPHGERLLEMWGGKSLCVSIDRTDADLFVREVEYSLTKTRAVIDAGDKTWDVETCLIGAHNLSNVMVAVGMAQAMGFSTSRIAAGLAELQPVPGRLEPIDNEDGKRVFVDYAHTPDALQRVLSSLKSMTSGRLIVVFGCGGNRDTQKRPEMGKAVAEHADLAVVTNDNPRDEDPDDIARQVESGLLAGGWSRIGTVLAPRTFVKELDRFRAIEKAVGWMEPGDVLIVAGKGHEQIQVQADATVPFDDREQTRRILQGLPPMEAPPPMPPPDVEVDQVVDSVDLEPDIVGEVSDGDPGRKTLTSDGALPGQSTADEEDPAPDGEDEDGPGQPSEEDDDGSARDPENPRPKEGA
ncbi:MAG: UDP-N-acetylmuramoyl-L-alanyl-D-glutamate--2,6-diaminopimelate ligase [Myxococcota bacterium]